MFVYRPFIVDIASSAAVLGIGWLLAAYSAAQRRTNIVLLGGAPSNFVDFVSVM